jgi:signal peptidase II
MDDQRIGLAFDSQPEPDFFMPSPNPWKSPLSLFLFFGMAVLLLAVDLTSKYVAFDHPQYKLLDKIERDTDDTRWILSGTDARERQLIPGWFHLRATVNEGAVFGLGQGKQAVFVAVSFVALAFLSFLFWKSPSRFEHFILGVLLAGVLGNMYDRVQYNYVRDMFFALPAFHWPGTWQLMGYPSMPDRLVFPYIFNVADVLLVCGVCVLLIKNFLPEKKEVENEAADKTVEGKA